MGIGLSVIIIIAHKINFNNYRKRIKVENHSGQYKFDPFITRLIFLLLTSLSICYFLNFPITSFFYYQKYKKVQKYLIIKTNYLPIMCLLAKISDVASTWEFISASSIRKKVWSPLAPIHVAFRPYFDPILGMGAGFAFQYGTSKMGRPSCPF